ncbi:MAG: type II toxin-antitoxin system Phd/YefM family antitoxin [Prevotellaceae bacterium]|jgi:PHD/YefM family antitoxin component YafN of YafNO toxin-antitoxin module|nr:type II toxin-antitoxin system Phd/YefM family antitoxin [Prevotellaceae bacterium]
MNDFFKNTGNARITCMETPPISYIKENAVEMMKYVNEHKNPIVITQNG